MTAFSPFITIQRALDTGPDQNLKRFYRTAFAHRLTIALGKPVTHTDLKNEDSGRLILTPWPSVTLSVSHSGPWVAYSASPFAVWGIDLEVIPSRLDERNWDGIAKKAFWPKEYQDWVKIPENQKVAAFLELWVKKESSAKAHGLGIAHRPKELLWTWRDSAWHLDSGSAEKYHDFLLRKDAFYFNLFCSKSILDYFPDGLLPELEPGF
ncbi:MAG: 4'-phosphopantetheinyl transferase superfamily protein [Bdellovibrionales bacterium]|nr:4'-phosphopantetheinyl transferase superfamily protein [Bdellovibrionales bacterium]